MARVALEVLPKPEPEPLNFIGSYLGGKSMFCATQMWQKLYGTRRTVRYTSLEMSQDELRNLFLARCDVGMSNEERKKFWKVVDTKLPNPSVSRLEEQSRERLFNGEVRTDRKSIDVVPKKATYQADRFRREKTLWHA